MDDSIDTPRRRVTSRKRSHASKHLPGQAGTSNERKQLKDGYSSSAKKRATKCEGPIMTSSPAEPKNWIKNAFLSGSPIGQLGGRSLNRVDPVADCVSETVSLNESDILLGEVDMEEIEAQHLADGWPTCSQVTPSKHSANEASCKKSVSFTGGWKDLLYCGASHQADHHGHKEGDEKKIPDRPVSMQDKIKQALAQNVKTSTLSIRLVKLKMESVAKAMKNVEVMQQDGSEFDLGPFYGLPSKVRELLYKHRKINELYDWQHECLSLTAVKKRRNLIYSLPTSGGKTLVAEVLMFKEILCRKKDVLFILPFVALVQEKVKSLSALGLELNFLVEEYAAAKGTIPPRKRRTKNAVYICTIEKANSLYNSLIEANRAAEIGLVVVDELHMLGEGGGRGACLEMILSKMMNRTELHHIVGMSATLSNINDLSSFLDAYIYTNNFRPVKLDEYVKMEDTLYKIDCNALCPEEQCVHHRVVTFKYDSMKKSLDPDHLGGLVQEVVPKHSCLIFCSSKKNCENVADLLCKILPKKLTEWKQAEKKALLKALWADGSGQICPVLRKTVRFGIAYHHSGLTGDERKLIEEAYTEGTLCVLCCTSTLAAGVNLPARRVILRSPYVGMQFMSRSQYKQMTGRAGRAGLDSTGESILIIQSKDRLQLASLVTGPMDHCSSSLLCDNGKGLRTLLLSTIGLKVTPNYASVIAFLKRTLYHIQSKDEHEDLMASCKVALEKLIETRLVQAVSSDSNQMEQSLQVTRIGRATFKGAIDVDRGSQLYEDLSHAQENLVLVNYLHLLYLVTPYHLVETIKLNWMVYFEEINLLDDMELKVLQLVGVSTSYICKRATGQRCLKPVNEAVAHRFYLTLILYQLWRGKTLWDVAARFMQPRGFVQNLLNGAASFASCISHFCQELEEFWPYQDLFGNFVKKLAHCFIVELMPLLEVPGVKIGRARQLHKAGYRTLQQVSYADPEVLVKLIDHLPRKTATQIVAAAKMMMQEKAEALQDEAQEMLTVPQDMPVG